MVLVWDNLGVHKGKLVKQLCRRLPRLDLEDLPAYVPEINPHEGVCRHTQGRLTNGCPADRFELALSLVEELENLRRSRDRLWNCITHLGLTL